MVERSINSVEELNKLAVELVSTVKPGSVILLIGEMGAGKTSFTQAFSMELGVKQTVKSPTFIVHSEYNSDKIKVHHLDLYRLNSAEELTELRIKDSLDSNSYIFIEWADKFEGDLMKLFSGSPIYKLEFEILTENERLIKFSEL